MPTQLIVCDGCGQPASTEHIARRLQRLEWATRYRPVHIGMLLLGAISPNAEADFLYAGKFEGEAGQALECVGINGSGKTAEAVLAEFQRGGYFLTYVLECPVENAAQTNDGNRRALLVARATAVAARIRRSLKPKRVIFVSDELIPVLDRLSSSELGCPVILDSGRPFVLNGRQGQDNDSLERLRQALVEAVAAR
jgi:hypothetical protein